MKMHERKDFGMEKCRTPAICCTCMWTTRSDIKECKEQSDRSRSKVILLLSDQPSAVSEIAAVNP
jgi:hypothetical protein